MVSVLEGRRPASVDEIALTEGAAADLDAGLGDQVDVGRDRYEVVGIVENPADLDDEYALVLPAGQTPESVTLLVDADREQADRFRPGVVPGQGFIESREVTEQTTAAVAVFVVATVAMVLVCLVAGASFATLAHRRMRQLGLLAAAGATPRHLRRAMVANGTAVGLTAAVAGTGAGLLAWLASASALEPAAAHRIDPWNIPLWLPVAGIGLAVATATVAAWWPARAVARMPITDAVAARPPAPRRVHRSLAAAVALFAYGVLAIGAGIDPNTEAMTPIFFISGIVALPVAVLLASAPVLRAVARLAGRFPVGTRLAVRDLARFESRSAAALGAITLALGIAVSVVVVAAANVPDADEGNLQADQLVVWTYSPNAFGGLQVPELSDADVAQREADVEAIAALAPGARIVPLDVAVDPANPEVAGGQRLLNNAVLGRPIDENTIRDSGVVFIATPELLDYLRLDADDQPPGTLAAHPPDRRRVHHRQHHQPDLHPRPGARRPGRAHRRPQPLVGPPHPDDRRRSRRRRARAHAGRLAPRPRASPSPPTTSPGPASSPPTPASPSRCATPTVASPSSATSPPPPACCSPCPSWR